MRLPVIAGFGGINAAGRSSFHHGYRRMVLESLPAAQANDTIIGLATLTGHVRYADGNYRDAEGHSYSHDQVAALYHEPMTQGTLVRRIEEGFFDPDAVHWQRALQLNPPESRKLEFITSPKQLPTPLPAHWQIEEMADGNVKISLPGPLDVKVDSTRQLPVQAAGQLPSGFNPGERYQSRFHPRGLQMTMVGASDAIHATGIDWDTITAAVRPDEIGVYAGSVLSQIDEFSNAGLIQARMKGNRVSSKQLAMGMNTMPGDFINAYLLGSVGVTGGSVGACATFLYTLRQGVEDIQSGRRRVVLVGSAEAPICPELIDGFDAMSALATDANLRRLDNSDHVDHRRASRPFGENCGFVLGESAQFVLLMDDELALELGAEVYGAVPHVFINADGYKKSISAPGPGNYITLGKAVGAARAIVGDDILRQRSFIQAHGSSTPQNRVSESLIFDRIARTFGIERWPVSAVKAYLGHSIGPASADQLVASLGVFNYGLLPGIKTIDAVADDVHAERLGLSKTDQDLSDMAPAVAFLNSKGFGGNNATASLLSPDFTGAMLQKRHGASAYKAYEKRREGVREQALQYEQQALRGDLDTLYRFGQGLIDDAQIEIDERELSLPGFARPVQVAQDNPYDDMV